MSSTQNSETTTTTRRFTTNWADDEEWDFLPSKSDEKKEVKEASISKDSRSVIMETFGIADKPATKNSSNMNITFKKGKKGKKIMDLGSTQEHNTTEDLRKGTRFPAMLIGYKCWLRSDQEMRKHDGTKREEELRALATILPT